MMKNIIASLDQITSKHLVEGYQEYEQLKDKFANLLIKAYEKYGTYNEIIGIAKPIAAKIAMDLGIDPESNTFNDAWNSSVTDFHLDTDWGEDGEDDYTDYSMRQGEMGNPDRMHEQGVAEGVSTSAQQSFDNSDENWKAGYKDYMNGKNWKFPTARLKSREGKKYRAGWDEAERAVKRKEEQGVAEGLGSKKVVIQGLKNWISKAEAEGYEVEEVMKGQMWRAVNPKTGGLKGTFHTKGTPGRGSLHGSGPDGTPADSGTLVIKQGVAEDVPVPTAMTAPEQSHQADAADAQQQAAMVAGAQAQKAQEVQAKRQEIQGQIRQYQKDITNLQRSLAGPL